MVAAGSSDRFVYIWDTTSRRILYKLPGHLGSVNDVDFHKLEPISKFTCIDAALFDNLERGITYLLINGQ